MTTSLTDDERRALDLRLLGYLRAAALRGRNHERIGPFLATFNRDDDNLYLNYAIPDDGAEAIPSPIAGIAAFRSTIMTVISKRSSPSTCR